jgi:hypothetical protein
MSVSIGHSSAPATRYDVVTAVWGEDFVTLFLDFCIPNQLSSGNLTALPTGSRYRIFTTASDARRLRNSSQLDDVRRVLPVDLVEMDLTGADAFTKRGQVTNTHKRMIACHRRAVADAAEVEAALIFLSPDIVLAEGTIASLVTIHRAGSRAVLTTGLRLVRETFTEAVAHMGGVAAFAPRELVGLAMKHLHSWTRSLMTDGEGTSDNPTSVYWPVRSDNGNDGLLVRTFSLHPLLVDPVNRTHLPGGPIDSHYVMHACPDLTQCHIADDSDEFAVFELSPEARVIGNQFRRRGISAARLAAIAATCNSHQRAYWNYPIRLHAGDLDAGWRAVEEESLALVRAVNRYRWLGPALVAGYSLRKIWRQRCAASGRTYRRARGYVRDLGKAVDRQVNGLRGARKALRPPVTSKQIARPARLLIHRAAKKSKTGLKQIRRRVGLL